MGTGACFHRVTLNDYFGAEGATEYQRQKAEAASIEAEPTPVVPENNITWFDPARLTNERKTFNNVKVRAPSPLLWGGAGCCGACRAVACGWWAAGHDACAVLHVSVCAGGVL